MDGLDAQFCMLSDIYNLERIALSNVTHIMSMVDLIVNQCGDTKDREWVLCEERVHWIDPYKSLNGIIPYWQSSWFMSWLFMWSFNLRHQSHLVDGWACFDYDLRSPGHGISKMSYIGYTMKSLMMIVW